MTVIVNGRQHELAAVSTGADLLSLLGLPPSTTVAEVNAGIVPRGQFAVLELQDGDVIELVTIVGGG